MSIFTKLADLKGGKSTLDYNRYYLARVVNNNDSLKLQRVQFRLKALHRNVQDADLPWASPMQETAQGNNSVGRINIPVLGSTILVYFIDDYTPLYKGMIPSTTTSLPELTGTNYPNCYGFIDASGNKFFVDTQLDTVTFTHLSGATIAIAQNGQCTVTTKNTNLNVNGNLNLKASGNVKISCQEFDIDAQTIKQKSTVFNLDSTTTQLKSTSFTNDSTSITTTAASIAESATVSYTLNAAVVTIKGGATTISSAAALTLTGASLALSVVGEVVLNAASFVLNAAFNLVPVMGWVTPPSPSPGSTTPAVTTTPTAPSAPVASPPTPLSPRTKPTITPFTNQINY